MFPPATPESQGLSSTAILSLIDRLEREGHDPHGLVVLRHGREIAAGWWTPYRRDRVHRLYSLSKSFTSTAVGLAVHEGRMTLDDPVLGFFPDLAPENPSENLRAMRVRDLLTMTCGQAEDASGEFRKGGDWARAFLAVPVPHAPGTHFVYNSGATYMLAAILARITGVGLLDYLRPRLLEPMGVGPARWETDPQGVAVGGWGLYVTTDAIAAFGQLLLQRGRWGDRQLVPEAWIAEATGAIADNSANENPDWKVGYGYQFWRSRHGFRADGAFGQFCLVLPEQDLVVAITGASDDLQGVLDAVWEEILAKLQGEPLPDDPDAVEALKTRLANLAVPFPSGDNATYDEAFTVNTPDGHLRVGMHGWIESEASPVPFAVGPIAARGSVENRILTARVVSLESTESGVATVRFSNEGTSTTYVARGTWGPQDGLLTVEKTS